MDLDKVELAIKSTLQESVNVNSTPSIAQTIQSQQTQNKSESNSQEVTQNTNTGLQGQETPSSEDLMNSKQATSDLSLDNVIPVANASIGPTGVDQNDRGGPIGEAVVESLNEIGGEKSGNDNIETVSNAVEHGSESDVSQPIPVVGFEEYANDSVIESGIQIEDKSEGIFLETTNETIVVESTHEEEEADTSNADFKHNNEDTKDASEVAEGTDFTNTEAAEIKVEPTNGNATGAVTTPKVVKKKSKTSTPTKNASNDSHFSQKRRKKDPAAPKAPLNGYLVYFNDERADMRLKNPNMGFGELTKIIALKWKDLPTDEKQRFITEADLDKERYVKEMAEYKKSDSYRQYVKETSQAKLARNDEILNNSMQNDNNSMNTPNSFSLANETNVAGFDIPIFTEEFIEHCKSRENEMRLIRKEITELEQQNGVLHKHIEMMKQSSTKLDTDLERYQTTNNQLKKKMDTFRQTIINCNIQLPNTGEMPTPNNIDDYIMKLYGIVANSSATGNQNDMAFVNHVKSVLSKINFSSLFE